MNIAFYISNDLSAGGAERVVVNLANHFCSLGNNITVITPTKNCTEFQLSTSINRVLLEENNKSLYPLVRSIKRIVLLRKALIKNKIQVLFAFLDGAVKYSIIATRFSNIKVVVSERNDPNQYFKTVGEKFWIRLMYDMANAAVFQTSDAKAWFNKKIQNRSKVIFNPVQDDFYNTERSIEENYIVTCGRYEPQKNQRMLVDAMEIACAKYPELKLSIWGTGSLEDELNDYIRERGLTDTISLEGNAVNVPNVLKKAELFVLSSDFEGAPNALMEAMAMGIPSISTDCQCGGPRMLLGENENGLLVPVSDAKSMAAAICSLHKNKELQKFYSENSKSFAEKFRMENIFSEWKSIIEIALN